MVNFDIYKLTRTIKKTKLNNLSFEIFKDNIYFMY